MSGEGAEQEGARKELEADHRARAVPGADRKPSLPPDESPLRALADGMPPWSYREALRGTGSLSAVAMYRSTVAERHVPSPLLGTAPHWSHRVRPDLRPKLAIDDAARRYDEDPHTERFLAAVPHTLLPLQSRYEVDMNRPPDSAVYTTPKMAWGREVWAEPLDAHDMETSLEKWYEFHGFVDAAVADAVARFDRAVLLDVHSYNYQRDGERDWRDDADRPVVNLGTGHLELDDWGRDLVGWARDRLKEFTVLGEPATFGENAVFYGGYINRRLAHFFGPRCVTLSIEFKKVFMDERTGEVLDDVLDDLVGQMDALVRDLGERLDAPVRDEPKAPGVPKRLLRRLEEE